MRIMSFRKREHRKWGGGFTIGMIQDNFPKRKGLSVETKEAEHPTHWIKAPHDEIS